MIARGLQIFSLFLALKLTALAEETKTPAPLPVGSTSALAFVDVDQNQLSLTDGHVTVVTVTTREDQEKARAVGDHVPTELLADPRLRIITMINFQAKIGNPFHGLVKAIIRHHLEEEAVALQKEYVQQKIQRSARKDLLVVADFNGENATKLGLSADAFGVFVFDGRGRLVKRWSEVPSASSLGETLRSAL